jgi:hypothetical protein
MSQIVDDLVNLVNGSSAQKISSQARTSHKTVNKNHVLTPSDHVLHQIAAGKGPKERSIKKTQVAASHQLPLDDAELKDFNG